jgi:DNA-binding transcriptional MerR regulator
MYTIKQAAARSGVSVPLLRAWERRYGIVEPARTAAGYRLYDDDALGRIRTMRRLVDAGWTPSTAAGAILSGEAIDLPDAAAEPRGSAARRPQPRWAQTNELGTARAKAQSAGSGCPRV